METLKTYSPEKEPGRLDYIYHIVLSIGVAIMVSMCAPLRHPDRPTSPTSTAATFLCITCLSSIWVLSKKIVTHIELDVNKNSLTIHYLTAWKTYNTKQFQLSTLMYNYASKTSFRSSTKWILALKGNEKTAFCIEQGAFSKETLDTLAEDLSQLKKK